MEFLSSFNAHLLFASLLVAVLGSLVHLFVKFIRCSPKTQIVLCMLALLPGCILVTYTIELPWLIFDDSSIAATTFPSNLFNEPASFIPVDTSHEAYRTSRFSTFDLTALLVSLIWVSGLCFVAGRHIKDFLVVRSLIHGLPESTNSIWLAELKSVSNQSCFRRVPKLLESAELGPMACFHKWQPAIVVPVSYWSQYGSHERTAILQHELAHHQRRDHLISLTGRLMCLFQWFNPVAWMAIGTIENSIELACDDLVVSHFKARPHDYAKTLVSLVEFRHLDSVSGPMSIAATSPPIQKRIERIVQPKGFEMNISKKVTLLLFATFFLSALLRFELVAQQSVTEKLKPNPPAVADTAQTPQEETKQPKSAVPEAKEQLVTKTYPVTKLLFPKRPTGWIGKNYERGLVEGRPVGGVTRQDFEVISDLIKSTVRPDWWTKDLYSIQPFPPNLSLIISCSESCHQEVAELLKKLNELTDVRVHIQARAFVVPKHHVLNKSPDLRQKRGVGELVEACRLFKRGAVATIELPPRTMFNGEQVKIELLPENKCRLLPFEFMANVATDRKSVNCTACFRHEPLAYGAVNEKGEVVNVKGAINGPTTVVMPAMTLISQHSIEHDGIQVYDISEALETNRDTHKAFLVAYATIHVREEAE